MSASLAMGATLLLGASLARAHPPRIEVEKATIGWTDLQRLIEADGEVAPSSPTPTPPPHRYALTASIDGQIEGDTAELRVELEVEVLAERWVLVPLLPANLAVASGQVTAPNGGRGLLVREASGVLLAAEGPGRYRVALEVEGPLESSPRGARLSLPLAGLTGGQGRIRLASSQRPHGRTPWRTHALPGDRIEAQAVLGAEGLDLVLAEQAEPVEASGSIEGLSALTVVTLGGASVTRLTFHATPTESGALTIGLPAGARLWKAFIDGRPLEVARLASGDVVQLALRHPSQVELAYTFSMPPLGLRGHYRVELPHWPVPVREAAWQLWLPSGLRYSETQAALGPQMSCSAELPAARTPLTSQGQCFAFSRSVLEGGPAYVEGAYAEPL